MPIWTFRSLPHTEPTSKIDTLGITKPASQPAGRPDGVHPIVSRQQVGQSAQKKKKWRNWSS